MPPKNWYDIAQHAQALTLLQVGCTFEFITEKTGILKRQVQYYLKITKDRGYDPASFIFKEEHLKDGIRTGRPRKLNEEREVVQAVRLDRYAREKISTEFGFERNVSASTIQRIFKRNNIHKVKPTYKPGLTNAMKAA